MTNSFKTKQALITLLGETVVFGMGDIRPRQWVLCGSLIGGGKKYYLDTVIMVHRLRIGKLWRMNGQTLLGFLLAGMIV